MHFGFFTGCSLYSFSPALQLDHCKHRGITAQQDFGASPIFTPTCTWPGCWVAVYGKLQSLAQRRSPCLRWKTLGTSYAECEHLKALLHQVGANWKGSDKLWGQTGCRHCQTTALPFALVFLALECLSNKGASHAPMEDSISNAFPHQLKDPKIGESMSLFSPPHPFPCQYLLCVQSCNHAQK